MDISTIKTIRNAARALGSATMHIGAASIEVGKVVAPVAYAAIMGVPAAVGRTLDVARNGSTPKQRKQAAMVLGVGVAASAVFGMATYAHFSHKKKMKQAYKAQKARQRALREAGEPGPSEQASPSRDDEGLTHLGSGSTAYAHDYDPSLLESFENRHQDHDYMVTLECPEFTTLCPITGQPDFATIYINYVPGKRMVESKSLKLYLGSFRNHGDFHEDVVNVIMNDLVELMDPKYIEVHGMFNPRGGISIYPFANWARHDSGYEDILFERRFSALPEL